ncbi:MAG: hypothetical protein HUJ72_09855 [Blautia sp.]|nr:hypothetical protein [Blautia sp.]
MKKKQKTKILYTLPSGKSQLQYTAEEFMAIIRPSEAANGFTDVSKCRDDASDTQHAEPMSSMVQYVEPVNPPVKYVEALDSSMRIYGNIQDPEMRDAVDCVLIRLINCESPYECDGIDRFSPVNRNEPVDLHFGLKSGFALVRYRYFDNNKTLALYFAVSDTAEKVTEPDKSPHDDKQGMCSSLDSLKLRGRNVYEMSLLDPALYRPKIIGLMKRTFRQLDTDSDDFEIQIKLFQECGAYGYPIFLEELYLRNQTKQQIISFILEQYEKYKSFMHKTFVYMKIMIADEKTLNYADIELPYDIGVVRSHKK